VIVFGGRSGLSRISEAGGPASVLTVVDSSRKELLHTAPAFLPDGRHFVYFRASEAAEVNGIYLGSLDAGPEQKASSRLVASGSGAVYVPSSEPGNGYLLFVREGTLMAQPLDNRRLELTGTPVALAEKVGVAGAAFFSASANGILAYRKNRSAENSRLNWYSREGRPLSSAIEPGMLEIALSPDGSRVAGRRIEQVRDGNTAQFESRSLGRVPGGPPIFKGDIWVSEFERGTSLRFTSSVARDGMPVWSPDGKQIVFASGRDGRDDLYQKSASGDNERPLLTSGENKVPLDWTRNGFLLYSSASSKTGEDLWVLPLNADSTPAGPPSPYANSASNEGDGRFSPDGHWIAYRSNESGRNEVYVQSFPASSGGKQLVSKGGGSGPRWRKDGRELFYLGPGAELMAAEVTTTAREFRVSGPPKVLFVAPIVGGPQTISSWDVAPNGQRFLLNTPVGATRDVGSVNVILNWQSGLKK
jgi:hypothetical protein